MKKVYLILKYYDYEGYEIITAFDSYKKAKEFISKKRVKAFINYYIKQLKIN